MEDGRHTAAESRRTEFVPSLATDLRCRMSWLPEHPLVADSTTNYMGILGLKLAQC